MNKLFEGEERIDRRYLNKEGFIDMAKRRFISRFFSELPIEDLEKLVDFKIINLNPDDSLETIGNSELLSNLRRENKMMFTCELRLEVSERNDKDFHTWLVYLGYTKSEHGHWLKDSYIVSGSELWNRLDEFKNK